MLKDIFRTVKKMFSLKPKQPNSNNTKFDNDIIISEESIDSEAMNIAYKKIAPTSKTKILKNEKLNLSNEEKNKIISNGVRITSNSQTYIFYSNKWYKLKNSSKIDDQIISKIKYISLKKKLSEIQKNIIYENRLYSKVDQIWYRLTQKMTFAKKCTDSRLIDNLNLKLNNDELNNINFWDEIKMVLETNYIKKLNEKNRLKKEKEKTNEAFVIQKAPETSQVYTEDIAVESDDKSVNEYIKSKRYTNYKIEEDFINRYVPKIKNASYGNLSIEKLAQLVTYIYIYKSNNLTEHWEVNKLISRNDTWDDFDELRSLNDHGNNNKVKGIMPKYFAIICKTLGIDADDGAPLLDYEKY
jgi:hypothetical protein